MRTRGKIDANHNDIVLALRKCGASVVSLAGVGEGVPDLLVGFRGVTCLVEIKDGTKPPSQRKLTEAQIRFHSEWNGGTLSIVDSVDAALRILKVIDAS